MVIDTSAVVAIFWQESGHERFLTALEQASVRTMSAVNAYEAAVVIFGRRQRTEDIAELWHLLRSLHIEIAPFGSAEAADAAAVYGRYGKGIHPAGLNIGDCPAYSLARGMREPLLFQGEDFTQTDIDPVSP